MLLAVSGDLGQHATSLAVVSGDGRQWGIVGAPHESDRIELALLTSSPSTGRWLGERFRIAARRLPRRPRHPKAQVRRARIRASRVVSTELLLLYWDIGRAILDRQAAEG